MSLTARARQADRPERRIAGFTVATPCLTLKIRLVRRIHG